MCGITGIISRNTQLVTEQKLKAATNAVAHRGPEDEGFYINKTGTSALGHRRLCIIDLSIASKQPMQYLNRYYIVHNGEIYNYLELKEELEKKGYTFSSNSDTEVILAAYDAYKKDCLKYFDGAFAFAVWDEQEQELFAARDRFGEKPFFFYYDEEQLIFGSTINSIVKAGVEKNVNLSMVYNFISVGYTTNPFNDQETFFENIYKLPAASALHYSLHQNQLTIEKYWQLNVEINHAKTEEQAIEQFQYLFSNSIHKRLRSDVAIGTSLSGGLDSSSIVAFCSNFNNKQYSHKCFTAAFDGFEKDETSYAKMVADQFQLQHYLVNITANDLVDEMEQMMFFQEEPVGSASVFAQYKVYQFAKQNGITVLLDGQGADEILAGYTKYYKWYWQELYKEKNLSKSGELKSAIALGIQQDFNFKNKLAALFPDFAFGILQSSKAKKAYQNFDLDREFTFANKRFFNYTLPSDYTLNGALYFNTFINGLEELLRFADRNSMAHAAEVRLPFLNYQLVEFLFSLLPNFKIKNGWTKWLLRKTMDDKLPKEIVWRKDKVGFEPPQKTWMQNNTLQEMMMDAKKTLVENKILNAQVLNKKIKPHDAHAATSFDWRYFSSAFLFK